MLRTLFLGAICFLWLSTVNAQMGNYYWADNQRVELTASNTHFIITANTSSTLTNVNPISLKQYKSWAHKPYAVAETSYPTTTEKLVSQLGLKADDVKVSTGYALSDGFIIYPTRTVVAKLIDKDEKSAMESIAKRFGVKSINKKFGTYRIELNDVKQAFEAANALQESGLFHFAQPDFYAPIERFQINDPLFNQQFQMHNTGQTLDGVTGANDADCNALEAWGISIGSSSITVAVIDDGMEDHEDFNNSSGQSRYTAGFSPANNGNGNAISGSAHGVACAGSITASHNNIGVRGLAPLANIISVNIFVGGESTQDIADGFVWAKNQGADVMSNSWGYSSCTANFSNINNAMADADANGRGGLGSVVIFASGNDYNSCVSYPAKNSNVIAVGAFANTGVRSAYSNYGPTLDIVAPSNNVGGPGAGVRTTDRTGNAGYGSGPYTPNFGGTSSACPVVAGVATLVLGYNPNLTSAQVKDILYSTAIDMGSSGFDNEYGNGRVNAFGALQAAGGGTPPTCDDGVQNGNETGVDCGGSCAPCSTGCTENEVTITFVFDNYPEETSWTLTSGNTTVASGGTYGNQAAGSTLVITECLAAGCYDFTINDAYGDGICCSYGNGSYTITSDGVTLASGGAFATSETKEICIEGAPAVPGCTDVNAHNYDPNATEDDGSCETCSDGVQNGDETGVDCGGAKCEPCANACQDIQISITFDNYPEETSWTLTSGGTTVASGGTYGDQADGSTINLTGCLPLACYEFTITDAYGDGICCSYGNGSYTVSSNGAVLVSGGSFGSSETQSFCLTNAAAPTLAGEVQNTTPATELKDAIANEISIFPNPAKDILNVSFSADSKEISISILNQLGQVIRTQNVAGGTKTTQLQVTDLTPGNYFINVIVDGERSVQKFVKY